MIREILIVLFVISTATAAVGETVLVDRGVEVPGVWRPERHLYVKGDLGIPRDRLDAFADWLAAHAPNWTVVLMKNARGETFRAAAGQSFSGMDAVEHALGKTLPATTAFGELSHPRTGEKNGAYFILYLEERKLAYHASEAYDRRRLGEDHWIGNLDAAAIAAMRGGGRVLDAAKDTVTSIDRELERRIGREIAAREREAEAARRAKEETAAAIAETRQRLTELEGRLDALRRDFNNPPGDLASAPLAQWSARLDAAERALALGGTEAAALTQSAAADIAERIRALFDHEAAPARLRALWQEFDEMRLHEFSAAGQDALLAGRARLQAAEESHARADSAYLGEIAAAEAQLADAAKSDRATRDAVARLEQLEARAAAINPPPQLARLLEEAREKLRAGSDVSAELAHVAGELQRVVTERRRAVRRREMLKAAAAAGGGLGAAGLLLAGWRGNRRRRGPRARALELFAMWETTLRERSGDLLELLDRTSRAIGSVVTLDRSGWTGETMRLSRQTLADVDHLFILASGLDRVLEQARQQLFPESAIAAGFNHVSSGRFERALDLLDKQPVSFSPDDPLRPILHGREAEEPRKLFSERSGNEASFTLTFRELNETFRERATRAVAALEVLETCWIDAERSLVELDAAISATEAEERVIHQAAEQDGLFEIAGVFDSLLPGAREDQERAAEKAATDPVAALRDELPRGTERAADAAGLCWDVARIRREIMPALERQAQAIEARGRQAGWIGEELEDLSVRSGDLAVAAVDNRIAEDLQALSADADALAESAATASALAERAAESCAPAMEAARLRTDAERRRLGGLLGVASEKILCESPALDPSRRLDQAASQHAAALAGIDLGDVAAASHALDACDRFCLSIHEVIDATAEDYDSAGSSAAKLDQEADRVAALVPQAAAVLGELEQLWSPSALRPASADPAFPDAEASVSNNIHHAERVLQLSRHTAAEAREKHRSGHILHAADLRNDAAAACAEAEADLAAIHAHAAAIDAAVAANADALAALDQQLRQLSDAVTAPQITTPTQHEFGSARQSAGAASAAVMARGASANPFEAARLLETASAALQAIEVLLNNDRQMHEEAARSLDAAERELTTARKLAHRSQTDNIPDSPETTRCLHELELLERELAATRQTFAIPHGDWEKLDETADRITADAARLNGRLRGELDLAEQSVQEINTALAKVRAASAMSGTLGSTGSGDLEQARAVLSAGDYLAARSFAAGALRKADQAIRHAEAEALRRRREEERRREAARRRRMTSSSFGSTSSFGSRSSFSSGSGSSRSSFSSGSGTSRSGW